MPSCGASRGVKSPREPINLSTTTDYRWLERSKKLFPSKGRPRALNARPKPGAILSARGACTDLAVPPEPVAMKNVLLTVGNGLDEVERAFRKNAHPIRSVAVLVVRRPRRCGHNLWRVFYLGRPLRQRPQNSLVGGFYHGASV
jgi:hypothetical protein